MQETGSEPVLRPSHIKLHLGVFKTNTTGRHVSFKLSSLVGAKQRQGGQEGEGCHRWAKARDPAPSYPHFPVPRQEIISVRLLHAVWSPTICTSRLDDLAGLGNRGLDDLPGRPLPGRWRSQEAGGGSFGAQHSQERPTQISSWLPPWQVELSGDLLNYNSWSCRFSCHCPRPSPLPPATLLIWKPRSRDVLATSHWEFQIH